jgi:hypothetical protein
MTKNKKRRIARKKHRRSPRNQRKESPESGWSNGNRMYSVTRALKQAESEIVDWMEEI